MEKRAPRKEYRAYRQLEKCDKQKPGLGPEVYFAREYRNGATLLVEHLPQVAGVFAQTTENALCLADRIFEISLLSPIDAHRLHEASDISRPGIFDLFLAAPQRASNNAGESMRKRCEELARRFAGQQVMSTKVPCHNDLHWNNISAGTGQSDGGDFRFIDWELFGLNWIGADLHFFVRRALAGRIQMNFWQALLGRYAERAERTFRADQATIELAAYCYALYRSLLAVEAGTPLPLTERLLRETERLMDLGRI